MFKKLRKNQNKWAAKIYRL